MAKRRDLKIFRFPTLVLLVLGLIFSVVRSTPPAKFARAAAGDVTLTGSPFSDPDAEDTHLASQWQVRDAGGTIFDSGTDAVNLTTITLASTYFTQCTTYYWKVRYQDQHSFWSDWSDEASFDYTCPSTPTPTPAPTATPVASTTVTTTATPTPTATPPPASTCSSGDWFFLDGQWRCTDVSLQYVEVLSPNGGEHFRTCNVMPITYYWDAGNNTSLNLGSKSCTATEGQSVDLSSISSNGLRHDIYVSSNGGSMYTRVAKGFDFGKNATWHKVDKNNSHGYCCSTEPGRCEEGKWVITSTYNFLIPSGFTYISDSVLAAVHLLSVDSNGFSSYDWGNTVAIGNISSGTERVFEAYDSSDNNFQIEQGSDICPAPTPIPGPEPTGTFSPIFVPQGQTNIITVISPKAGDAWRIGTSYQVLWTNMPLGNPPEIEKVNVYLSTDAGKTYDEPLALSVDNTGVIETTALERYKTNHAVIKVEDADTSHVYSKTGYSGEFSINESGTPCGFLCHLIDPGPQGGPPISTIEDILILGAIIASILPWIILLIVSSPILARTVEKAFATDLMPLANVVAVAIANLPAAISHPFTFFYLWKNRRKWGIVYDSISKQPIAKAAVRIFSQPDGKMRQVQYTNEQGKFGFLVPGGKYTIVTTKSGFVFPTHLIRGSSDGEYGHIYKGEELVISKSQIEGKGELKINIPLDQSKVSYTDLALISFTRAIQEFFAFIRVPFMLFGVLLTVYAAVKTEVWYYWLILGIYIILWVFEIRRMLLPRSYGTIKDENGKGIPLALVRVLDQNDHLKATFVSGNDGKFSSPLAPGNYHFTVSRAGYYGAKSDPIKVSKTTDLGKIDLKMTKVSEGKKVLKPAGG